MVQRIKKQVTLHDLDIAMRRLTDCTGTEYSLELVKGGLYRLANKKGSYTYSKRVSKRELHDQIWLAIEVLSATPEIYEETEEKDVN